MDLGELNRLPAPEAEAELLACCASPGWASRVAAGRPYQDEGDLLEAAEEAWWAQVPAEWRAAFAAHPRIGERATGEGRAARWSQREQSGTAGTPDEVMAALAECNRRYEEAFGHVFVVFASGRSAADMLELCRERLDNDPTEELAVAAVEQAKITALRLRRLLGIG